MIWTHSINDKDDDGLILLEAEIDKAIHTKLIRKTVIYINECLISILLLLSREKDFLWTMSCDCSFSSETKSAEYSWYTN